MKYIYNGFPLKRKFIIAKLKYVTRDMTYYFNKEDIIINKDWDLKKNPTQFGDYYELYDGVEVMHDYDKEKLTDIFEMIFRYIFTIIGE